MKRSNEVFKSATQSKQILSGQKITADGPGTILRDVQTMIGLFESGFISRTSAKGGMPSSLLAEINARLSGPLQLGLSRALLRDYPNIAGVFVLLRVMGLVRIENSRYVLDPALLAVWRGFNPAEQYFALLEAWLFLADGCMVGCKDERMGDQSFSVVSSLSFGFSSKWKTFTEYCHLYPYEGAVTAWNTQLMVRFGLLEVEALPVEGRSRLAKGWIMGKGRRTDWGQAVAYIVLKCLKCTDGYVVTPEGAGFGTLKPGFSTYFPDWKNTFRPPSAPTVEGVFILKISLSGWRGDGTNIWRRLAVAHSSSLCDLANLILQAFEFDDDHLHEFKYRDQMGKERVYNDPRCEDEPFSDEVSLGESGLPVKKTMAFIYDFGDDWEFSIKLEKIDAAQSYAKLPALLESHGEPPEQYSGFDDE